MAARERGEGEHLVFALSINGPILGKVRLS
jgi:hypothetical protein